MPFKAFLLCLPFLLAPSLAAAQEPAAPPAPLATPAATAPVDPENVLVLDLSTGGRVRIQLRPDLAPSHTERVKTLARQGFYNGVIFHRVIEGFMAQTGDPTGTGQGGSELPDLKAEFNAYPHLRGTVSMARASFGRVIGGMEYVEAIPRGEPPANPARIVQASVEADGKASPAPLPAPSTIRAMTADELNAPLKN